MKSQKHTLPHPYTCLWTSYGATFQKKDTARYRECTLYTEIKYQYHRVHTSRNQATNGTMLSTELGD